MCRCENLLALEDSEFRGTLVLGPWAGAVALGQTQFAKRKEFAGRGFHEAVEAPMKRYRSNASSEPEESDKEARDTFDTPEKGKAPAKDKKKQKLTECIILTDEEKDLDFYALLEIGEGASEKEIKDTYRKLVLVRHPDKLGRPATEEDRNHFSQIQRAYEVISDVKSRRQYDSMRPFDDDIPERFNKLINDFFKSFGPVFERNARFSEHRPVPLLGDADTSLEEVRRFYKFWGTFETWRDPLADAQQCGEELCDLTEAENREERRWMEQENNRIAKRYRRAELERIGKLVELAKANDPRLLVEAERKKQEAADKAAAKLAAEEAEAAAKARAEEEAAAAAAAEEAARVQKKEAKKAERDAARRAIRDKRIATRTTLLAIGEVSAHVCEIQLTTLLADKSPEDCDALLAPLQGAGTATVVDELYAAIRSAGMEPREPALPEAEQQQEEVAEEPVEAPVATPKKEAKLDPAAEKKRQEQKAKEEKKRKEREAKRAREVELEAEREKEKAAQLVAEKEARDEAARRKEAERTAEKAKKKDAKAAEKAAEEEARKAELQAERTRTAFVTDRERLMKLFEEGVMPELPKVAKVALGRVASLFLQLGEDAAINRACLVLRAAGQATADLGFPSPTSIEVPTALRNQLKKARTKLRTAVLAQLRAATPSTDACAAPYAAIVAGEVPAESSFAAPTFFTLAEEEPKEDADAAPAEKAKKKKGGKAEKPAEEDLDAILEEFGVTPLPAGKKKGKKK